jgi:hypothetical protein
VLGDGSILLASLDPSELGSIHYRMLAENDVPPNEAVRQTFLAQGERFRDRLVRWRRPNLAAEPNAAHVADAGPTRTP